MDDILFTKENTDSIVFSIVKQFKERARLGKEKYGTDLDREDLSLNEWLQHAQEENMDAILYLEKIKKVIDNKIIIEKDSEEANNIVIVNIDKDIEHINFLYQSSIFMVVYSICAMIFSLYYF
uniref:Uncharacterized protein n=1 Tax=viral metagenome TaxID=1070528 RepID=A0A6C0JNC7_9ZZZZ